MNPTDWRILGGAPLLGASREALKDHQLSFVNNPTQADSIVPPVLPFTSTLHYPTSDNVTMSESLKLLHEHRNSDSDSEPETGPSPQRLLSPIPSPASSRPSSTSPRPGTGRPNGHPKRQSSFAQARADGAPRTPNRVRFEEDPVRRSMNGDAIHQGWNELETDDYLDSPGYGGERIQRLPLLTGIEAPSVTVATDDFDPEQHLENAKPRSGMRSAFMNMANSIIGAGIIGQPYAFRNAGLITGTVLLVGLTVTVDWTIRLIVINSKLSGTDSFQSTVEHCFGKSGLVAISLAQWLLWAHLQGIFMCRD